MSSEEIRVCLKQAWPCRIAELSINLDGWSFLGACPTWCRLESHHSRVTQWPAGLSYPVLI